MTDNRGRPAADRGDVSLDAPQSDPEQDGVAAMHDTEAQAGDEAEVADMFALDRNEARQLGRELDRADRDESRLD